MLCSPATPRFLFPKNGFPQEGCRRHQFRFLDKDNVGLRTPGLFSTALAGIPVSTTHTITGAIVGVGATQRLSAVRWGVARRIVWAWVVTIPASALVAAVTFWLVRWIHPGA